MPVQTRICEMVPGEEAGTKFKSMETDSHMDFITWKGTINLNMCAWSSRYFSCFDQYFLLGLSRTLTCHKYNSHKLISKSGLALQ